jgi:AcrR family transcriptional regulator
VPSGVKRDSQRGGGRPQARTRLARRAVVDAARALVLERGYAATTMEALSARADVPPATVYRLFSSKLGVLKALLDTSIAGDDAPVAVSDRPAVANARAETDPREVLTALAGITTAINQRTGDVYRVLVGAAATDAAAAELLGAINQQRDDGQRQFVRTLARNRALRAGLRERDAADVVHALLAPDVYRLLVADRGWRPERYQRWLADALVQQLL